MAQIAVVNTGSLVSAVADYLLAGVGEHPKAKVRRFGAQAWGEPSAGLPLQNADAHLAPECSLDGELAVPPLADHRALWTLVQQEWA